MSQCATQATSSATAATVQDAVLVALAKGLTKKTGEVVLKPGVYPVNEVLTVSVRGSVKKAADTSYTPTADIPMLPTLALLLERAGFTRESSKAVLVECMTAALQLGDGNGGEAIGERIKDATAAMASVREVTAALPKKSRAGATTCQVEVEVLPMPQGMPMAA